MVLERWGLGECVEGDTALSAAVRLAGSFSGMSARSLRAYTELAREAVVRDLDQHLARCASLQAELFNDRAFNEAVSRKLQDGKEEL